MYILRPTNHPLTPLGEFVVDNLRFDMSNNLTAYGGVWYNLVIMDRRKIRIRKDCFLGELVTRRYGWYVPLTQENLREGADYFVYIVSAMSLSPSLVGFVAWSTKNKEYVACASGSETIKVR